MTDRRVEEVPQFLEGRENELLRKLSQSVNDLQKGRGNFHFSVTLRPNALTTEVLVEYADSSHVVDFSPASASSATAIAAGVVWAEATTGKIVIHHDSQVATDRKLGVLLVG